MFTIAALYHFTRFKNHLELRDPLQKKCEDLGISGSLLLASEGINGTIAGTYENIEKILVYIKKMPGCANLEYKTSVSKLPPFPRMKVKLKKEIVTMGQPNIDPKAITDLISYMNEGKCDIGTLASSFTSDAEIFDENNVKVALKEKLKINQFGQAIDFFRKEEKNYEYCYHHVGIYAFTNKALVRYVSLKRSKLELERKLEQMRALENSMTIHVGYINSSPLSVDTKNDLIEVRKIMEKNG